MKIQPETLPIPVSLMRGGTSKGVFLDLALLPSDRAARDALVRALLGSPDPMQLDGLGGTHSSTSKLVAVATAEAARSLGYDVPSSSRIAYLFAQVGTTDSRVDWSANCGNLTSAVLPYAALAGLLPLADRALEAELFNLNTRARILSAMETHGGEPAVEGDFAVAGVPGTGARVALDYLDPAGGVTGVLFPSGARRDRLDAGDGLVLDATILDVTSPAVAVRAADVGIDLDVTPDVLNQDPVLLTRLAAVRGAAAVRIGLAESVALALTQSPAIPRLMLIAPPDGGDCDLVARMTSMGKVHHAFPGTGLAAAAVLALTPGTVADGVARSTTHTIRVRHPKGVVEVGALVQDYGERVDVKAVSVPRTARQLMRGTAYVRYSALG